MIKGTMVLQTERGLVLSLLHTSGDSGRMDKMNKSLVKTSDFTG